MKYAVDCFLLYEQPESVNTTVEQFKNDQNVRNIYLLARSKELPSVDGCGIIYIDQPESSDMLRDVARMAETTYSILYLKPTPLQISYNTIPRMVEVAETTDGAFVYADHNAVENGKTVKANCIEYQLGAVRNDFDFGPLILLKTNVLRQYLDVAKNADWKYAALYDFRLFVARNKRSNIVHVNECLYTEQETDLRKSGEKQFDYVNPNNREVQIEMEKACTAHLKKIGAFIASKDVSSVDVKHGTFRFEASVIIPVKNRVKTVKDAVMSALEQQTDFDFNVIVVDNHSDDGTTDILNEIAKANPKCIHLIPETYDLGIGGCWNLAVSHEYCGRFAVQLDSDDLYSSKNTLQTIVNKFYEEQCAMVIGAYRMCDFQLNTLPPGIIDHREWTDENGRNNALRINGLGAPRAFYTPLLREIRVPNTSYGEDYALGLSFSRNFKIGRIYDELYLCRRWEGNSDAQLTREKVNEHNFYKDFLRTLEIKARQNSMSNVGEALVENDIRLFFRSQLREWQEAKKRYEELKNVKTKTITDGDFELTVQYNPARIKSTGADISKHAVSERPCFLCAENRPMEQRELSIINKYQLLVNPYPILPVHFTIPSMLHKDQTILEHYKDMMDIAEKLEQLFVFYNGPKCGASAPDHMHFQMGKRGIVPFEKKWEEKYRGQRSRIYPILDAEFLEIMNLEPTADDTGIFLSRYICPLFIIVTRTPEANDFLFRKLYKAMLTTDNTEEPMMNIMAWTMLAHADNKKRIVSVIIPRDKHRPDCYFENGNAQCIVSPGALDMAGLVITPRETDFNAIDYQRAVDIITECGIKQDKQMEIIKRLKEINNS